MKKISCIMPAYNEGERISNVLSVVVGHPLIDEVIVIDDGSKDNTKDIINKFQGIIFIEHKVNQGKSKSVYDGIVRSEGEFILMLDTDLIGLTATDVSQLIEPIINGKADLSISLRGNTPNFWKKIGLDYISGERVFSRKLINPHLEEIPKLRGYGLEVFLNRIIIKNKCRIKVVPLENVESPLKFRKLFRKIRINSNFYMAIEIMKNISIFEIFSQIVKMRRLIVK